MGEALKSQKKKKKRSINLLNIPHPVGACGPQFWRPEAEFQVLRGRAPSEAPGKGLPWLLRRRVAPEAPRLVAASPHLCRCPHVASLLGASSLSRLLLGHVCWPVGPPGWSLTVTPAKITFSYKVAFRDQNAGLFGALIRPTPGV